MAYEDLDLILEDIRGKLARDDDERAAEEAGLGPRLRAEGPSRRRFHTGAGIADAVGTALQRGGETFVQEATAPIRDIPGGIEAGVEALQEDDPTVLGRLRRAGLLGLGGAQAGLSLARSVFSPVTAAMRTATELPLLLVEKPGEPRPDDAETARQVAQVAGEVLTGVGAGRAVSRLREATALRKEMAEALKRGPGPDNTTGRLLNRGVEPKLLPAQGETYEQPERVFTAGPPGSVTGKPVQVYEPGLKSRDIVDQAGPPKPVSYEEGGDVPRTILGRRSGDRIVTGARPKKPDPPGGPIPEDVNVRRLPHLEGESTLEALRRRAKAGLDQAPKIVDDLLEGAKKAGNTRQEGESLGQYLRRLKRERDSLGETGGTMLPESEPTVKDYFPNGMPKDMSMGERVKLHSKDELNKVKMAAEELEGDALDAAPPHIQKAVRSGSGDPDPNRPDWLASIFTKLKIRSPLSMTQIAKGDAPFERIVKTINDGNDAVQTMRDTWTAKLRDIASRVSKEDFEAGIRARDLHLPPANANQGQVATLFGQIADDWAKALSLDPSHPNFVKNYVPRLRQAFKIVKTEIQQGDEWVSNDVLSHFPSNFKPYFTKTRKLELPGENYSLDAMIGHSNAVARAAVYGTPQHHGILKDLQPMLNQMKDRPTDVQNFVANYLNYAVGHPAFRSSEFAQKMGGIVRTGEFMRTIGASITSPLYNTMQRALTASEVSAKSFAQALQDEVGYYRGQKDLVDLVKKARVPLESLGPRKLETETIAQAGSEKLGKLRDWLSKPFGYAERGNRAHAFFAGYRDALSKGADETGAIQAGRDLVQKTQFMPGPGDKPAWMRKELWGTLGQFKYFQTKLGEYMWNNFSDMFKRGDVMDPERLQAMKKFVKFWGISYALGGPQVAPVMGEWLEKHDPIAWKGLGPALGVALTDQLGTGAVLPKDVASLKYYLPGPVANHAIDILNGVAGVDVWNPNTPPSVAARARAFTRSIPIAGVQLERLRKAAIIDDDGVEREPQTAREAFGLDAVPTQRPVIRRDVSRIGRFTGLTDPEQEAEYRMMDKLNKANIIKNRALSDAAQAQIVGDKEQADRILREAEESLGIPRGRLQVSPQSIKAAKTASQLTPLERRRKASGKALRDYGMEDTLP